MKSETAFSGICYLISTFVTAEVKHFLTAAWTGGDAVS